MELNIPKMQKAMRWIYAGIGIALLIAFIVALQTTAQADRSLDYAVARVLGPVSDFLKSIVFYSFPFMGTKVEAVVVWMALPIVILTVYYGFINVRGIRHAIDILKGHFADPKAPGDVSQVQALATALSGTVGLGNIAGVAIAVAWGGPGAAFWLFVIGIGAMAVKFTECTLAVKYRHTNEDGSISGGPMYYLAKGLKNRGLPTLGAVLAIAYGMLTLPSINQWATINQAYSQISLVTGLESGLVFGIILAFLTALVIIGGIKEIAAVTVRMVPLMAGVYLVSALAILGANLTEVPHAFAIIFIDAFDPQAIEGGLIGVIVIGMRRAVYSTEAGLGSSSIAHAAAKTREPVSEGFVGLTEPLIDVSIGSMTALIIVVTGAYQQNLGDIQMTSYAFSTVFSWFPYLLAIAVFLFAFSTIISWSYYLEKVWTFLFGGKSGSVIAYKTIYILLIIPGAVLTPKQVFNLIDSIFFLLAVPNILGLFLMAPEIKADLKDYLARLKAGRIPRFDKAAKKT